MLLATLRAHVLAWIVSSPLWLFAAWLGWHYHTIGSETESWYFSAYLVSILLSAGAVFFLSDDATPESLFYVSEDSILLTTVLGLAWFLLFLPRALEFIRRGHSSESLANWVVYTFSAILFCEAAALAFCMGLMVWHRFASHTNRKPLRPTRR